MSARARLLLARLLILLVLGWNLQCALAFLLWPGAFAPAFELAGVAGEGMVRGMGLLFVMWNVPYAVALTHPARRWVSLCEALGMQALGLVGETLLLGSLPAGHAVLSGTVLRFIAFDGAGLLLLAGAAWLSARLRPAG